MTRIGVGIAFAMLANAAGAVPITFTVSGGSATASGLALGPSVSITPSDGLAHSFDLNLDGGPTSHSFNFLDVTASGIGVVAGTIEAMLNFSSPETATAHGILGGFAVIFGLVSGGGVTILDDPGPIAFGNGGLFDVDFLGFTSGCVLCTSISGSVTATVSLLRSPVAVPEPATLALLGAGLIVLGFSRRRVRV
jgi:hypothetical protein